ncbi:hypothetical protein M407DRAFT_221600 [Tulasnella calospora MUT 4182]|uniref:Pre-rRNA-processing protein RIX1 N-terminal domain-containing protein n=1 Tax=Tulasnella calospora MUT 4182 TaxID=1051891 RepID=A0A0C3MBG3_9AGAM|nr:hypothetical protein M407DRAFT_221600 [Tulasnella calospora MUT 4182]
MDNIGGILQHQLATDATTLAQMPIVLQTLTADHLKPSQPTGKWMARINSLLHSREPSFRWAGLCLADKTSELSVQLMLEHAETWIGIVLPMLSKVEVEPVHTMSIRLLFRIFSSATHMTEFQRQVSTPNVSRYALAMVALAEKGAPISLQASPAPLSHVIIFETIHALISIYPSVLRTGQSSLQKLALRHVSGSFPAPTPPEIISSASKLLATLHISSGKTASSASWKKMIEGVLATAAESLAALRTTFASSGSGLEVPKLPDDPMIAMPLALDRLRCMTSVVSALVQTESTRTVMFPLASTVQLAVDLLKGAPELIVTTAEQLENQDIALRAFQLSFVPSISALGCQLTTILCESAGRHLIPYAPQLVNVLAFQISQPDICVATRTWLLRTLPPIIYQTRPFHSSVLPNRVARGTLSTITTLLSNEPLKSESSSHELGPTSSGRGKGKKRARGYEGDELLRNQPHGSQLNVAQSEEMIAAVDVLEALVASGFLSQPTSSTIHRVLLSLALSLPQQTPQAFSKNLNAYENFQQKVFTLSAQIAQHGKDGFAARSLGTVLSTTTTLSEGPGATKAYVRAASCLESVLHPRLPPLLKTAPPVEFFPLFRKEETKEEREIQEELRLSSVEGAGAPGTLRNGFTHTATTGSVQNQSGYSINVALMPDTTSASPVALQPPALQKATEPLPTAQSVSVSSFPSGNTTSALNATSAGDSSAVESDSRIHPYEQPEWAVPSTHGQTEPSQAPTATSKETHGSPLRLTMSEDEDGDQQIPEIDMRSDTEDEE